MAPAGSVKVRVLPVPPRVNPSFTVPRPTNVRPAPSASVSTTSLSVAALATTTDSV